jgi:thiosulfate/3-mercaptopyruvate sulfurtransferase
MLRPGQLHSRKTVFLVGFCASFALLFALLPARTARANQDEGSEPWTDAQLVRPADLARELANAKGANRPTIVYVGVRALFEGAHIPGAVSHGPGMSAQGLADLKKWAQSLPRSTNIVIYCGCCPFDRCPNVRPAFAVLRDMGFHRLRVLVLITNLATDWAAKGYPVEKGK